MPNQIAISADAHHTGHGSDSHHDPLSHQQVAQGQRSTTSPPRNMAVLTPESSSPRFIHNGAVCSYNGSIFDKLQDSALYTGIHKYRFDEHGRGRGIAGRDSHSVAASVLHFGAKNNSRGSGNRSSAAADDQYSEFNGSSILEVSSGRRRGHSGGASAKNRKTPLARAVVDPTGGDVDSSIWTKNLRAQTHHPSSHKLLTKDGHCTTIYRDTAHLGTAPPQPPRRFSTSSNNRQRTQSSHNIPPSHHTSYHQDISQSYSDVHAQPHPRSHNDSILQQQQQQQQQQHHFSTPIRNSRGDASHAQHASRVTDLPGAAMVRPSHVSASSPSHTNQQPPRHFSPNSTGNRSAPSGSYPPPSGQGLYIQYEMWKMDEEGNMTLDYDRMLEEARKVEALHALRARRLGDEGSAGFSPLTKAHHRADGNFTNDAPSVIESTPSPTRLTTIIRSGPSSTAGQQLQQPPPPPQVMVITNKANLLGYTRETGTNTTPVIEVLQRAKEEREREAMSEYFKNAAVLRIGPQFQDAPANLPSNNSLVFGGSPNPYMIDERQLRLEAAVAAEEEEHKLLVADLARAEAERREHRRLQFAAEQEAASRYRPLSREEFLQPSPLHTTYQEVSSPQRDYYLQSTTGASTPAMEPLEHRGGAAVPISHQSPNRHGTVGVTMSELVRGSFAASGVGSFRPVSIHGQQPQTQVPRSVSNEGQGNPQAAQNYVSRGVSSRYPVVEAGVGVTASAPWIAHQHQLHQSAAPSFAAASKRQSIVSVPLPLNTSNHFNESTGPQPQQPAQSILAALSSKSAVGTTANHQRSRSASPSTTSERLRFLQQPTLQVQAPPPPSYAPSRTSTSTDLGSRALASSTHDQVASPLHKYSTTQPGSPMFAAANPPNQQLAAAAAAQFQQHQHNQNIVGGIHNRSASLGAKRVDSMPSVMH